MCLNWSNFHNLILIDVLKLVKFS